MNNHWRHNRKQEEERRPSFRPAVWIFVFSAVLWMIILFLASLVF